jgi:hypothetical protein
MAILEYSAAIIVALIAGIVAMTHLDYLSELFRIVDGALRLDGEKVRNYSALLANKLESAGETSSARRLRQLLDRQGHQLHPAGFKQQAPAPIDNESRFPLVQRSEIPKDIGKYAFTDQQKAFVDDYLAIARSKAVLEAEGVDSGTNLLLYGPPGCGKTYMACFIAHGLNLPLYVVRLDGLISSFLGSTAKNIRAVLEFASKTPCVLLLDEFDAIAKLRDDEHELGELKRVVNSFIQNLDALGTDLVLIAATNHERLLDPAIWRRFQYLLQIGKPDAQQREQIWEQYSESLGWSRKQLKVLSDLSAGFSCSAIHNATTKLRQRKITQGRVPTLREAFVVLCSGENGVDPEVNPLSAQVLDNPRELKAVLQKRDPRLYSMEIVGEIAGYSRATMIRLDKKRQERSKGGKDADARK